MGTGGHLPDCSCQEVCNQMVFLLQPCPCSNLLHWVYKAKTPEIFKLSLHKTSWTCVSAPYRFSLPNLINFKVYSITTKLFYPVAVSMFFANSVIQMVVGLKCSSICAACWLNNNNKGVDTKFTCTRDNRVHCGGVCPTGYNGIHCTKIEHCLWVEKIAQKTNNTSPGLQIGVILLLRVVVMTLACVSAVPYVRVINMHIVDHSMQVEHARPPEPWGLYLFASSTIPNKFTD